MGHSVIRHDPMWRLSPIFVVLIACATPDPPVCDLNEIVPIYGSFGWNEDRTDVVEKPIQPTLIPCSCDVDPLLASFGEADPIADAESAYESGGIHFLGLPKLGTIVPGFSSDLDVLEALPNIPAKQIPGSDEGFNCYERERLELEAQDYAVAYNTRLLELLVGEGLATP